MSAHLLLLDYFQACKLLFSSPHLPFIRSALLSLPRLGQSVQGYFRCHAVSCLKGEEAHLTCDRDAMMLDQVSEQEAAACNNPWPHVTTLCEPK